MEKYCVVLSDIERVKKFINKNQKLLNDASGDTILASIIESFKGDFAALNILKEELNKINIYYLDDCIDLIIVNTSLNQLHPYFSNWDLTNRNSEIDIFGSNIFLNKYIKNNFTKNAFKYCILDTSVRKRKPLVLNNDQLIQGISNFKQELIFDLIKNLNIEKPNKESFTKDDIIFNSKIGADIELYNYIMQEVKSKLINKIPLNKDGLFDLKQVQDDKILTNIIYDVFVLNNFDNLLDELLGSVIVKSPISIKGNLNRTKYELQSFTENEVYDLSGVSDHVWENATNFINPVTDLIIQSIPVVNYSVKNNKGYFYYSSIGETLTKNDVLQLSHYLQLNLGEFETLLKLDDLDFLVNPVKTLYTLLDKIHEVLTDRSLLKGKSNDTVQLRRLLKNDKNEIKTALSLYEFLFNNKDRIDKTTRSIYSINQLFKGTPKLDIINSSTQLILQSYAPAFEMFNFDGTLWDENSESDPLRNNRIQKAGQLKGQYAFNNVVISYIYNLCLYSSEDYKKIIEVTKNISFKDALNKKYYLDNIKRLLAISLYNDDVIRDILLTADEELDGKLKEIISTILNIIPTINTKKETHEILQEINRKIETSINLNLRTEIGQLLSPFFGTRVNTVFTTNEGNMLGIFRNASLVFWIDHLIKRVTLPSALEQQIKENNSKYIFTKQRSNFFVQNPKLFRPGNNANYKSNTAIPVNQGEGNTIIASVEQPEFIQIYREFVGHFMSLLLSHKNGEATPMIEFQIGAFSDKVTTPHPVINCMAPLEQGPKNLTFAELLENNDAIIKTASAYGSTRLLILVNKIVEDWKTIIQEALTNDEFYNLGNDDAKKYIDNLRNLDNDIRILQAQNNLPITGLIGSLETITEDLLSTDEDSHSNLFDNWLKNYNKNTYFYQLMGSEITPRGNKDIPRKGSVSVLKSRILNSVEKLNKLFNDPNFSAFISEIAPHIASKNNIKLVKNLYAYKYKINDKSIYQFNRSVLHDLDLNCAIPNFELPFKNGVLVKPDKNTFENYHQRMVYGLLNKEYVINGRKTTFFQFLSDCLTNNKDKFYKMINQNRINNKIKIFDQLYYKNDENEIMLNQEKLVEVVSTWLLSTNFLRHEYLDVSVKEPYVDNTGDISSIELEKSGRGITTSKRNNTYTATVIPFIMDLITGVSQKTKICVIDDIKGEVFNTISQDSKLDEFDGLGIESPFQIRMEDNSLIHTHRVDTKKTFITPINDYSAEELKWAVNGITNKKIRESVGCDINLRSIFRRMHSIPFDPNTDLSKFWYADEGEELIISLIFGKNLYYREGFKYYYIHSYKKIGDNLYEITRTEVNNEGEKIGENISKEYKINSLFDLWIGLGAENCMELTEKGLQFSENNLDFISLLIYNVGDIKNPNSKLIVQSDLNQPLRNKFIGILATHSSNKRGACNIIPGKAWFNDNIPLPFSEIEIACGGKQLDAEHAADGSSISKGTQLIQDLAQKGYNSEIVENLYYSLAELMNIDSKTFNKLIQILELGDIKKYQEEISKKICKDLKISGLTERVRNLISAFITEHERINANLPEDQKEEFILPLSLMSKEIIKSYAPELNKNIIKQKDSGLMGTLTGSSGFVQYFNIGGKFYNVNQFLKSKNLNSFKEHQKTIELFCKTLELQNPNRHINIFNNTILQLSVLKITGTLDSDLAYFQSLPENIFLLGDDPYINKALFNLLEILNDDNRRFELAKNIFNKNPDINKAIGYEKIRVGEIKPGDVITTIDGKEVIITSSAKILELTDNNNVYVLKNLLRPSDLKPQVFEIKTKNGQIENEYTSFESQLGARLNRIGTELQTDDDWEIINSLIQYLNKDRNLTELLNDIQTQLEIKDVKNRNLSDFLIKKLKEIQEELSNFKNHVKAQGYTLSEYPNFTTSFTSEENFFEVYYGGFDPRKLFEHLLQKRIIEEDFLEHPNNENIYVEEGELTDSKSTAIQKARKVLENYCSNLEEGTRKEELTKFLNNANDEDIKNFIARCPEFFFTIYPYHKKERYKKYLDSHSLFDKITESKYYAAQLVSANIYRKLMKLGNVDITDIDLNSFKKAPTFYEINSDYIIDGIVNIDFVVRTFKGKYNIVVSKDLESTDLEQYGELINPILDEEGYRLDPKSRKRLYKLPTCPYLIRIKNNEQTIILLDKNNKYIQTDIYKDIKEIFESDNEIISIQPFLYNIVENIKLNKLNNLVQTAYLKNTISTFNDTYEWLQDNLLTNSIELKSKLSQDYINLEDDYKNKYHKSMYTSFLRSLEFISTRIPTLNMSSIMPMVISAYTDSDTNDIFVTKWQQWLQGSDYD